jgi:hypothetical protein
MANATKEDLDKLIEYSNKVPEVLTELEKHLKTAYEAAETVKKKPFSFNPLDELNCCLNKDYEDLSDAHKDLFYYWHKKRVFTETKVAQILPKNTETHTIVTGKGNVCIVRSPIGRVLGSVMSKIGAFSKDPDFYEAGSIIFRECKVYVEKPIENDPDELFSVKMACLGATNMIESRIKKN